MKLSSRGFFVITTCLLCGMFFFSPGMPLGGPGTAGAQGKPALYDFGMGMCIPCKEMEKILGSVKGKYGSQVEVRLLYVEKEKDQFEKFKIVAVPTQIFLDASGQEVFRHMGLYPEAELVKKLKELNFIKD